MKIYDLAGVVLDNESETYSKFRNRALTQSRKMFEKRRFHRGKNYRTGQTTVHKKQSIYTAKVLNIFNFINMYDDTELVR